MFDNKQKPQNMWLFMAAILTFLMAILHICMLVGGPDWYRLFGAGEQMVLLVEYGHWYPTVLTLCVIAILFIWSIFGLSGSGVLPPLLFYKPVLCMITAVFLTRGLCFYPPFHFVDGLSYTFWMWSSLVSLLIGITYLNGLMELFYDNEVVSTQSS